VPRRQKVELVFAPETVDHVKAIDSQHHSLIRTTIEQQLRVTPGTPTRNRKRLETPAPFDATWELRFGPDNQFRVLYEVDEGRRVVNILAIGIKDRNRLLIGREEFK
jgi:mRNA-degrading endonuclease RelE of RelBE toxin-antitoxin system